jgi:hypothetical protein
MTTRRPPRTTGSRPPRPGQSLAELHPQIGATWHPHKNGALSAGDVGAGSKMIVHWLCPAGHGWSEPVAQRIYPGKWKGSDPAACRECCGIWVHVTHKCGHAERKALAFDTPAVAVVKAAAIDCADCRHKTRTQASTNTKRWLLQERRHAGEMVDALPTMAGLPGPIRAQLRPGAVRDVAYAIVSEKHYGTNGAIAQALNVMGSRAGNAVPTLERIAKAEQRHEPVKVGDRGHWPAGWLHWHAPGEHRVADEPHTIAAVHAVLEHAFTTIDAICVHRDDTEAVPTPQRTALLTTSLREWSQHLGWRPYAELGVPVMTTTRSTLFGRLDLVIFRAGLPDLVIELDATNNPDTVPKLDYARDAGALVIWVRWGAGHLVALDGVVVLDFVSRSAPTVSRR